MTPIRHILVTLLGLNILVVLAISFYQYTNNPDDITLRSFTENGEIKIANNPFISRRTPYKYSFTDPYKALRLLEAFDIYEEVKLNDLPNSNYKKFAAGYTYNDNYCKERREYFVYHPEELFNKVKFETNYWRTHKLRTQMIPAMKAEDLHPEVVPTNKTLLKKFDVDYRLDATMFFNWQVFFTKRQVGKQFSCLSQNSNHIPGHDGLARKDSLGKALVSYAKSYESRPDCFNFDQYFPKTWVMQKKDQCLDFFKDFNSPNYPILREKMKVVYFRKVGAFVHEGKGVFPVLDKEENELRTLYKNGSLCGEIQDNFVMQFNIHDLLLIQGRKFGVRMYLFVASVNPVLAYYHDGYLRLSLNEYDPESKDKGTFVTNIGVNLPSNETGPPKNPKVANMTKDEIEDYTCWFLEQFKDELLKTGVIKDPNWLDNYLRPQYKKVMVHLVRMAQSQFLKKSSVFEIYGIDFIQDKDLKIWFIEANPTPLINGFTKESTILLNKVMIDVFEIVIGLTRSRMKRVIDYINKISSEIPEHATHIPNLEAKRAYFKKITTNYFEPEFKPSPTNGFTKIIDEQLTGIDRYAGLIPEECL